MATTATATAVAEKTAESQADSTVNHVEVFGSLRRRHQRDSFSCHVDEGEEVAAAIEDRVLSVQTAATSVENADDQQKALQAVRKAARGALYADLTAAGSCENADVEFALQCYWLAHHLPILGDLDRDVVWLARCLKRTGVIVFRSSEFDYQLADGDKLSAVNGVLVDVKKGVYSASSRRKDIETALRAITGIAAKAKRGKESVDSIAVNLENSTSFLAQAIEKAEDLDELKALYARVKPLIESLKKRKEAIETHAKATA